MNKLLILALAAFVCGVSAGPVVNITETEPFDDEASQLALWETDENETAGLSGDKLIFKEFCTQTREDVKAFLSNSVNSGAARIFNLFVETAAEAGEAISKANSAAAEEGHKQINEDVRKVPSAFGGIASAAKNTAGEQIKAIYDNLKSQLTVENLTDVAHGACKTLIDDLNPQIAKNLKEYKTELKKNLGDAKYTEEMAKARVENLGCVTTRRLSNIVKGCRMVSNLGPMLMDFMNLS